MKSIIKEIKQLKVQKRSENLDRVYYWLAQTKTVNWLTRHWNSLIVYSFFIPQEKGEELAKQMLFQLGDRLFEGIEEDITLTVDLGSISLSVGINTFNWTLFAVAKDRSLNVEYFSKNNWDLLASKDKTMIKK